MNVRLVASRKKMSHNETRFKQGLNRHTTNKTLKFIVIAGRYIALKAKQNKTQKKWKTVRDGGEKKLKHRTITSKINFLALSNQ